MIRGMEQRDISHVLDIENICFPDSPWNEEQFLYELKENHFSNLYVYVLDDMIVGYIDWWITYEISQVANVAVSEGYRNMGVAQKLLDSCIKDSIEKGCENISLEVRQSNEKAIRLYEKNGFIKAGVRKKYYPNGEDGDLMIKPIGGLL